VGKRAHKSLELDGAAPRYLGPRRRRLLRYMAIGFLLTFILTLSELWFEHSTVAGSEFRRTGYRLIQHRLSSTLDEPSTADTGVPSLPVTVVDISDLELETAPGTDSKVTPRPELQRILEIIGAQNPSTIGIDIDFSPDEKGWIDPNGDPQFFDVCLNLKGPDGHHIPVYLGVNRALTLGPAFWLGNERYEALAASMIVPRGGETRAMITELQVPNSRPLPSLAARLAEAYRGQQPAPFWARAGESLKLLDSSSQPDLKGAPVKITEALIDYGPRTRFQQEKISYQRLQSLGTAETEARFSGKMVVIGAAELGKTADVFSVMGEEPTPGPIVIACAAYTLAQTAPLYELTDAGHIVINLGLSLVVFLLVGGLWYSHPGKKFAGERVRVACTLLVATAALLVGVMSVRHTRVVWDGFLIVLIALAFHSRFELFVDWLLEILDGDKYRLKRRKRIST